MTGAFFVSAVPCNLERGGSILSAAFAIDLMEVDLAARLLQDSSWPRFPSSIFLWLPSWSS